MRIWEMPCGAHHRGDGLAEENVAVRGTQLRTRQDDHAMTTWSQRTEFWVVVTVAFGYFIASGVWALMGALPTDKVAINDAGMIGLILMELVLFALLAPLLWARGWRPAMLGLEFSWQDLRMGFMLFQLCFIGSALLMSGAALLAEGTGPWWERMEGAQLSVLAILAVSIVNPIFEEVFVCGYVIRALERTRGTSFAVNASVALRASYHLYQGALGVLGIIVIGLILGWWFARKGRLWPVILAHGLLDLVALLILGMS